MALPAANTKLIPLRLQVWLPLDQDVGVAVAALALVDAAPVVVINVDQVQADGDRQLALAPGLQIFFM